MKIDVVLPSGNESELIAMAEKLGFDGLILAYPSGKVNKVILPKPPKGMKIIRGVILDNQRPSIKGVPTFVEGSSRHGFEKLKPDVVFANEYSTKPDKMNSRNSGLDDVVCRIANKEGISIGFSFSGLLKTNQPRRIIIGRVMQNIRFCRKFRVQMFFASFARLPFEMRSLHDMKALGISLGMTPPEAQAVPLSRWFKN